MLALHAPVRILLEVTCVRRLLPGRAGLRAAIPVGVAGTCIPGVHVWTSHSRRFLDFILHLPLERDPYSGAATRAMEWCHREGRSG